MKGKIVEFDALAHQKVQKLLPWLMSGSLSGAEVAQVRMHLSLCQECRDDLAWHRQLCLTAPLEPGSAEAERAVATLNALLGEAPTPPMPRLQRWRQRWSSTGQWQRRTMLVQALLIVLLVAMVVRAHIIS